MKYKNLTLGEIESLINRMGGMRSLEKFVAGDLVLTTKDIKITPYPIVVDYSRSLQEMIAAGDYGPGWGDFTEADFPARKSGKMQREALLISSPCFRELEDLEDELRRRKLRHGDIWEILALGAQHPDLQRDGEIAVINAVISRPPNGRRSGFSLDLHDFSVSDDPELQPHGEKRDCGLTDQEDLFFDYDGRRPLTRFLVFAA